MLPAVVVSVLCLAVALAVPSMGVAVLLMGLVLSVSSRRGCCRFRRRRTGRVQVRRRAGDRRVSDERASEPAVVEEARAALEAGVPWRARDLLAAHVESERDPGGTRPARAGAPRHGRPPAPGRHLVRRGGEGSDVDAAVAAWREQARRLRGHVALAPASVRAQPRPRRIEALRERARPDDEERDDAASTDGGGDDVGDDDGGFDAAWLVAWVLAIAFVVFAVIGVITALAWVIPG